MGVEYVGVMVSVDALVAVDKAVNVGVADEVLVMGILITLCVPAWSVMAITVAA
jgi:hypothetical protein